MWISHKNCFPEPLQLIPHQVIKERSWGGKRERAQLQASDRHVSVSPSPWSQAGNNDRKNKTSG